MGAGATTGIEKVASLGSGRYSSVALFRSKATSKLFAVKQCNSERSVINELKSLKAIQGDNFYSQGLITDDNFNDPLCLLLEPYLGGALSVHIARSENSRLTLPVARIYISQIICGLMHMHKRGVIHRDLKANNILLDSDGRLKICDFGCSKVVTNIADKNNTHTGGADGDGKSCGDSENSKAHTIVGSLHCIAPEMVAYGSRPSACSSGTNTHTRSHSHSSKGYSYSVDWWALGVLLFEMAVGAPPQWRRDATAPNPSSSPGGVEPQLSPRGARCSCESKENGACACSSSSTSGAGAAAAATTGGGTGCFPFDEWSGHIARGAIALSCRSSLEYVPNPLLATDRNDSCSSSTCAGDVRHCELGTVQALHSWYCSEDDSTRLIVAVKTDSFHLFNNSAIDLIQKLLCVNPNTRLGTTPALTEELLSHPFFGDFSGGGGGQSCAKNVRCIDWAATMAGAGETISDFDHRLGFLELCREYDRPQDEVSAAEQTLFEGF